MPRIKVCGLTREEDCRLAVESGAWALGFIFYKKSPRYISPSGVRKITAGLDREVEKVGVFVDAAHTEIEEAAKESGITIAQLHGRESPSFARRLRNGFHDVWKAFRISDTLPVSELERFRGYTMLLDTFVPDRPGGTGRTFCWDLARQAKEFGSIVLAGGLKPGNVAQALSAVRPYALDVGSGVESAPGRKDPELLSRFFSAAQEGGQYIPGAL